MLWTFCIYMYSVSIIADHRLTGKHPAVSSQLQDASLHACASASMMSSMETRSDQCDDDQSVVASHSHEYADEQGLSYLNYFVGYVSWICIRGVRGGIHPEGELANANCSQGIINRKKTQCASRLSKRDHEIYKSCFLLVTPISHTHSNYLHNIMHAPYSERSRTRTLAIDQYS